MSKKIILLFAITTMAFDGNTQVLEITQTTYTQYNYSTGMSSTNPFKKYTFREKGKFSFQKTGAFGDRIKPYFEGNQEALNELQQYKSKRIAATLSGVGAITTFITFAAINLSDTEVKPPDESGPEATGLIGVMAGFALLDFIFAASSNQHMINAVKIHNASQGKKIGLNIGMIKVNDPTKERHFVIGSGLKIKF